MKKPKLAIFSSLYLFATILFFSQVCIAQTGNYTLNPDDYEVYQPNTPSQTRPEAPVHSGTSVSRDYREQILQLFQFVDEFELSFREMKYLNIVGRLPEAKLKFQQVFNYLQKIKPTMEADQKILASLYIAKFELLEGLTKVMNNLKIDSGFRAALIRSGFYVAAMYNQLIDGFRKPVSFKGADLIKLKSQVNNIARKTQKYEITSKYLKISGNKIPKGEKIMVLEVKGNKALVLYMGPTMNNRQIEGWVSLSSLRKRTFWKRGNRDFYRP